MRDLPPDFDARLAKAREDAIRAKREGVLLLRRPQRRGEEPRSFIGGLPHLREDLEWPVSPKTGLPLSFIAQIDLCDVPRPAGVFFPGEGMLWFFADFSEGHFVQDQHTRVLFDPHPRGMAREREAPANLPTLHQYSYGWTETKHRRAFVEPKTALFLHLFDTFPDRPYERPATWEDFIREFLRRKAERRREPSQQAAVVESVAYMQMISELRDDAGHRAIGLRRSKSWNWHSVKSGLGEAHWPATSVDAEYALMSLGGNYRLSTTLRDDPCPPDAVRELAARVQDQIDILRGFGPRPLAPAERDAVNALVERVRRRFLRVELPRRPLSGRDLRDAVRSSHRAVRFQTNLSYPHAAFEIVRTMPEPEKYVAAEMLEPYHEWTIGRLLYFHQMFGHGSSPQDSPNSAHAQDYVLLLQLGGSPTLGFPLSGDAVMHYWIPRRDLARGRFDRVQGTWQAG
jgi:uncharacterized protein YwqG